MCCPSTFAGKVVPCSIKQHSPEMTALRSALWFTVLNSTTVGRNFYVFHIAAIFIYHDWCSEKQNNYHWFWILLLKSKVKRIKLFLHLKQSCIQVNCLHDTGPPLHEDLHDVNISCWNPPVIQLLNVLVCMEKRPLLVNHLFKRKQIGKNNIENSFLLPCQQQPTI